MKHTKFFRLLTCLVLVVLLAAAAWTMTGCAAKPEQPEAAATDATEIGTGKTSFAFDVTFKDGESRHYTVFTDEATVGAALVDAELIDGDIGEYGLYVTTVGGETLDWTTDGMYWAFYENGEYAAAGVDTTAVTDGGSYAFVATAG